MKLRLSSPDQLADLSGIKELSGIKREGNSFVIGAMTRHLDVANNADIKAALPALAARRGGLALLAAALSITGIILSVGASMFPFILPSSIDPRASLTVWDSSSSHLTLFIMLVCTAIFLPIILAYTTWVYHVLWGKVDQEAIRDESGHAY